MPIYEYECPSCAKTLEIMQKFSDPPVTTCPECRGPVTRLISRTSFQLKGSGWYATDYKKPASSPGPEKTATAEKSTTTEPAKADTKPTGGSETK